MPNRSLRHQALADEFLRRFAAALRGAQLYAPGHPLVVRNINSFAEVVGGLLRESPTISAAVVGDEVVVGDRPAPRGSSAMGELFGKLRARGIERVTIDAGVSADELSTLVDTLRRRLEATVDESKDAPWPELPHVRVGLVKVEERLETSMADMEAIRRLYAEVTGTVGSLWEGTGREGIPDPEKVRDIVQDLSQAVSQNRSGLLALTAIRSTDTYTFTHMVNVSILVMAQARGLGIDGGLLREFGVAGLMHDIGKVRTPPEILTKPDRLDESEYTIMKRHVLDGAEILRRTPDITPLAPIVAFEHHLRVDGTGYPEGVARPSLNLATRLTSIADVYDAMRSQRHYQQAFPSERILAVLQRRDKQTFDPHLVRRFVQLMGIYPVGTMVRLNTGALGVVLRTYPLDPPRPRVRIVFAPDGRRLDLPFDVDLWDTEPNPSRPSTVSGPAYPPDPNYDPLTELQ